MQKKKHCLGRVVEGLFYLTLDQKEGACHTSLLSKLTQMLPKMAKMAYLWSTVEKILIRTSAKELLSKGNQNPNFEIFVSHFAKILSPISASSTSVFAY